ncbi:MAG: glycosyltransferase [Candidatus Micrarchaeota archaeon]|nr:glycosyltransferase [Candidatus Micrarchaeota archaeon]
MMETGSLKVVGGAAKDTYKLYEKLRQNKNYSIDLMGDFSKIGRSADMVTLTEMMSKKYDLIWMNSIRDVPIAEAYRNAHKGSITKFLYVDRGNVVLNSKRAGLKKLLPKMIARRYLISKLEGWLDYYIAISAEQYEHARSFFRKNTAVKYIMIAPHEEYKVLKTKRTFSGALAVSRLDERQKKISFMIKGMARVKEMHPELRKKLMLKIVGTGVSEPEYRKLAKSLGLDENILFEGFLTGEPLIKEYNNAGFLVSTSEWEGLGRSLLEAMACGLPLLINDNINTLIKTKPETHLVKDGFNGQLYEYGNLEQFSDKFYELYSKPALQKRLSSNTKHFIKQFSFGNVVKSYKEIIDGI